MKVFCEMCQKMVEKKYLVDDGHGNNLCPKCWAWVRDEAEVDLNSVEPLDPMGEGKEQRGMDKEEAERDAEMDYIDQLGGVV